MKKFAHLMLAAVLGSVITLTLFNTLYKKDLQPVVLEKQIPATQVAFMRDEATGEFVPLDFTETAEKVMSAVVHIRSTAIRQSQQMRRNQDPFRDFFSDPFRDFFYDRQPPQMMPSQSTGSGVIINAEGYIVTNNHVIQNAEKIEVTLFDNRSLVAEVVGIDPSTDLAVLKIDAKALPYLSFVNSDALKVGEWVLAVGNPFNLNSTVTAGIISAKARNLNLLQDSTAIESFIQTDAAVNPGNSGGALVNLGGGLIGINTAIASPTGAYSGYSFAIPSNIVSKVVEDILKYGSVQRGWLGVRIQTVNADLVRELQLSVNEGAYIAGIDEKSGAKSAGIKEGDVITRIDGVPMRTNANVIGYVATRRPGDKIEVTVNRKGKEQNFTVTLKTREGTTDIIKPEEKPMLAALGLELEELDERVVRRMELKGGVRVKNIEGNRLSRTGMRPGFIITKIDDESVKSTKDIQQKLEKKKAGELLIISGVYENYPGEYIYTVRM
ncbi:MAG TPA: Do family serine endopeptidase [Cyclobacteriaceae bacterium]|mgnify:CR=1 FL=1|nr:Do family serine endopeptidase [Cyclobacteriaceae bacterium]